MSGALHAAIASPIVAIVSLMLPRWHRRRVDTPAAAQTQPS
ncbi:hypothetical protein [Actinomycetospora cinnamomea]|nr:hypothetical protein [Actinomycetospora cinnamomea]